MKTLSEFNNYKNNYNYNLNEKNNLKEINKLSTIKENEEIEYENNKNKKKFIAREILKKNDQFNFKNTEKNINLNGNVNKFNIYKKLKKLNKDKVNELNSLLEKINFDDIKKHEVNNLFWREIENLFEFNLELKTKYKNLHKFLRKSKKENPDYEKKYTLFKEKLVKKLEFENGILDCLIKVFKNPEKLGSPSVINKLKKNLIFYNNIYAEKDLIDFMGKIK